MPADMTLAEFRQRLIDARAMLLLDALVETGLCKSKSEARRKIREGVIKVDDWKVENELTYVCNLGNNLGCLMEFVDNNDVVLDIKTNPLRVKICLNPSL